MGVVPFLIFFHEASINTFLDPALDFFNLFLWSGVGTTPHSRLFTFRFQFQVHRWAKNTSNVHLSSHSHAHSIIFHVVLIIQMHTIPTQAPNVCVDDDR